MELRQGLIQVAGSGLTHPWDGCAYLIPGKELTLVDCGGLFGLPVGQDYLKKGRILPLWSGPNILDRLAEHGYLPGDIRRIILTHGHADHYGAAILFPNTEIICHELEAPAITTGSKDFTAGFLYPLYSPQVHVGGYVRDGEVFKVQGGRLEIYEISGHSPGSIVLVLDSYGQRTQLAGDSLHGHAHKRVGSSTKRWKVGLDLMASLGCQTISWGHIPLPRLANAQYELGKRKGFGRYNNLWWDDLPPVVLPPASQFTSAA